MKPVQGTRIGSFELQFKLWEAKESSVGNQSHYNIYVDAYACCEHCGTDYKADADGNVTDIAEFGSVTQSVIDEVVEEIKEKTANHFCGGSEEYQELAAHKASMPAYEADYQQDEANASMLATLADCSTEPFKPEVVKTQKQIDWEALQCDYCDKPVGPGKANRIKHYISNDCECGGPILAHFWEE